MSEPLQGPAGDPASLAEVRELPAKGLAVMPDGSPVPDGMMLCKDGVLRPIGFQGFTPGNEHAGSGGRRKGLARQIREMVGDDPTRIADVLFDILEDGFAKNSDRIAAAKELLDRGWGKAPTFQPIEGGDPLERSELDQAIRAIADELLQRQGTQTVLDVPTPQRLEPKP